jgi:hypothetical protein
MVIGRSDCSDCNDRSDRHVESRWQCTTLSVQASLSLRTDIRHTDRTQECANARKQSYRACYMQVLKPS